MHATGLASHTCDMEALAALVLTLVIAYAISGSSARWAAAAPAQHPKCQ